MGCLSKGHCVRLDPPFFQDPTTKSFIDLVANQPHLGLYVGSGVTISQTGLSWPALIQELIPPELETVFKRSSLTEVFGNNEAASVVVEMFKQVYGTTDVSSAGVRLRNALRTLLYRNGIGLSGPLTDQVSRLLVIRSARQRTSCVLTTNYDNHLDLSLQSIALETTRDNQLSLFGAMSTPVILQRWSRSALLDTDDRDDGLRKLKLPNMEAVDFVYLHGYVPDSEDVDVSFENHSGSPFGSGAYRNFPDLKPVLAEDEYASSASDTRRILTYALERVPTIMLGSSLDDPPLMRALLETRDGSHPRWAVIPLQGAKREITAQPDRLEEYKRYQRLRLEHFNVVPIFPHYFSQVGQLVQEIALATQLNKTVYPDAQLGYDYGSRLATWWDAWEKRNLVTRSASSSQVMHHRLLQLAVEGLRESGLVPGTDEHFKLELWLRWNPRNSRHLRLWASSIGTFTEVALMRVGEVDSASQFAAIRNFCYGGPQAEESSQDGRWRSYLSLPITSNALVTSYAGTPDLYDVPVAVVTMFSTRSEQEHSRLGSWNRGAQAQALKTLRDVAQAIVDETDVVT